MRRSGQAKRGIKHASAAALKAYTYGRPICSLCSVDLIDGATLCASCSVADQRALALDEHDAEDRSPCDFCGERTTVWVSELGEQRFEGDDTPARICGSCATRALEQLRAVPA